MSERKLTDAIQNPTAAHKNEPLTEITSEFYMVAKKADEDAFTTQLNGPLENPASIEDGLKVCSKHCLLDVPPERHGSNQVVPRRGNPESPNQMSLSTQISLNSAEFLNKSRAGILDTSDGNVSKFEENGPEELQNILSTRTMGYILKSIGAATVNSEEIRNTVLNAVYYERSIIEGSELVLKEFACQLHEDETPETQGVIVSKDNKPKGKRYDKEVHYSILELFGKGSFGTVNKCIDKKSQKYFVSKMVKKEHFHHNEVLVALTVDHVNLAKVYGLIKRENGEVLELLQEFAGQSLFRLVQENKLTEGQIWQLTKQGLSGLAHLHVYWIIHLDIKPENLCVQVLNDGQLLLKIIDFGSSKLPSDRLEFIGNTPEYLPPEICKLFLQAKNSMLNFQLGEDAVTGKVDVFAFALTIMFMYKSYHILQKLITNGELSYNKYNAEARQALQQKLMITMVQDRGLVENLIPDEVDLDMRDLLSRMVKYDHVERASAAQGLKVVEDREKRLEQAQMCEVISRTNLNLQQQQKSRWQPTINYGPTVPSSYEIPELANCFADFEAGPIKSSTKNRLRSKLSQQWEDHVGEGGKIGGKNNMETSNQARRRYGRGGGSGRKVITTHPDPLREVQALAETCRACPMPETPVEDLLNLNINSPPPSTYYDRIAQSPGIPHVFGQTTIDGADIPNPNLLMLLNEDKMWVVIEEQNEEMFCLGMEEEEPQFETDQFMLDPEMQSAIQFREEAPVGNILNFDNLN